MVPNGPTRHMHLLNASHCAILVPVFQVSNVALHSLRESQGAEISAGVYRV
jgi:hypothetical protein